MAKLQTSNPAIDLDMRLVKSKNADSALAKLDKLLAKIQSDISIEHPSVRLILDMGVDTNLQVLYKMVSFQ